MIVNLTLGHILLLLFPAALSIFLLWLCFAKWKWNERLFAVAFIPGAILYLFLWGQLTTDVILIDENLDVERSMVFFSASYESPDHQKMHVSQMGSNDVFIVNASDEALTLERVSYGESFMPFNFFGPTVIPPHRTMLESDVPDYFPKQMPPHSVSVGKGIKSDSKDWLRKATEEEVSNASENSELVKEQ
jgi:hypothetical protein